MWLYVSIMWTTSSRYLVVIIYVYYLQELRDHAYGVFLVQGDLESEVETENGFKDSDLTYVRDGETAPGCP